MQNRDDVDGSQRPQTADAPNLSTPAAGHLGPAGDPVEGGRAGGGVGQDVNAVGQVSNEDDQDHLGPSGDPVEGDEAAIEADLNSPAKE
ncbi:MAG: hypothetical protein KY446_07040 [Proteobacteria bacterium]|nr:hypothetical protein [Pseudomonadota bacterium]